MLISYLFTLPQPGAATVNELPGNLPVAGPTTQKAAEAEASTQVTEGKKRALSLSSDTDDDDEIQQVFGPLCRPKHYVVVSDSEPDTDDDDDVATSGAPASEGEDPDSDVEMIYDSRSDPRVVSSPVKEDDHQARSESPVRSANLASVPVQRDGRPAAPVARPSGSSGARPELGDEPLPGQHISTAGAALDIALIGFQAQEALSFGRRDADGAERDPPYDDARRPEVSVNSEKGVCSSEGPADRVGYQVKDNKAYIGVFDILVHSIAWTDNSKTCSPPALESISASMDRLGVRSGHFPLGAAIVQGDVATTVKLRQRLEAARAVDLTPGLLVDEARTDRLLSFNSLSADLVHILALSCRLWSSRARLASKRCSTSTPTTTCTKASLRRNGSGRSTCGIIVRLPLLLISFSLSLCLSVCLV